MNSLVLIAVNNLLLLRYAIANPIGHFSGVTTVINSTDNATNDSSGLRSPSDTINHYCLHPPQNFPSIYDLFIELNSVIDVFQVACTNNSFKENVIS